MNEYLSRIERLDLEDSSELINNSSTEHAVPLVAKLFARGRQEILLFTGSLSPKIYAKKSVVDALGVFLIGRSGKVRVLIQDDDVTVPDERIALSEGGLISKLKTQFGNDVVNSITVSRASEHTRSTVKQHFLVVDGKGFRFEPDNTKHEAVASFNLPKVAEELKKTFDGLFADGRAIALTQ